MSSTPSTTETKVVVPAVAGVITLTGKVAIVTGSSRGIGAGIALRLARDGAKVVVNYLKDKAAADAVVAAIVSAGGAASSIQGDVSSSSDVDRIFSWVAREFGRIDIVVANSGVGTTPAPIAATTNDEFDRIINVNLKGAFYTLRAAANHVEANGRIVVIGSALKTGTQAMMGAYSATKVAVEILANTLAQEVGAKGITVNTIHPGGTRTDMLKGAPDFFIQMMVDASPFKRLGTIADIGDAVALFVSESARWISGQNVLVNGASK